MQLILTKKFQKNSFYSCVPLRSKIMSLQLRILNLSKFLFQKCKSWDLTGNTFLCVSSILIDPQRHTVPPFKDKFIINNSFYKIEAIRVKLQSLDFKTGPSILFVTPCNLAKFGSFYKKICNFALLQAPYLGISVMLLEAGAQKCCQIGFICTKNGNFWQRFPKVISKSCCLYSILLLIKNGSICLKQYHV